MAINALSLLMAALKAGVWRLRHLRSFPVCAFHTFTIGSFSAVLTTNASSGLHVILVTVVVCALGLGVGMGLSSGSENQKMSFLGVYASILLIKPYMSSPA